TGRLLAIAERRVEDQEAVWLRISRGGRHAIYNAFPNHITQIYIFSICIIFVYIICRTYGIRSFGSVSCRSGRAHVLACRSAAASYSTWCQADHSPIRGGGGRIFVRSVIEEREPHGRRLAAAGLCGAARQSQERDRTGARRIEEWPHRQAEHCGERVHLPLSV